MNHVTERRKELADLLLKRGGSYYSEELQYHMKDTLFAHWVVEKK